MQATTDTVVSFTYKLTNGSGELIDESTDEPLVYLHGHGGLIPGVEQAMEGKEAGEAFEVSVSPEEGYGTYDPELDLMVPWDQFPPEAKEQLQPGVRFQAQHPKSGEPLVYTVHEADDEGVKCSGNHALAGQDLHFDIEVVEVREATTEEVEHGHVHGAGGVEH